MNERKIVYANGFRIAMGAMETQILLRIDTPIIDEQNQFTKIEMEDVADIRINPSLAKQLYLALQQHIEVYEKNFGTLFVPENTSDISEMK